MDTTEKYKIINESMNNTYELLMSGFCWESLPPRDEYWILDNVDDPKVLDRLIEYFTSLEEYEKCARLVKLKKELKEE